MNYFGLFFSFCIPGIIIGLLIGSSIYAGKYRKAHEEDEYER